MTRDDPSSGPLPIQFSALGRTWRGHLDDNPSGRELARHLPLELFARRFLGAYAARREQALSIWLDPEPRRRPRAGDLAWWPGDSSLCVYLPASMDEDPGRPALPPEVNVIGHLEGELGPLTGGPHQVRIRLATRGELSVERLSRRGYDERAAAPLTATRYAPGIHVGPAPDRRGIERLAKQGIRSLLDLRDEGEPGQTLSPNVAASWAHATDLVHLRAPISRAVLQPNSVDRFLAQLARAPRPVYVHSDSGRRAAALLAIHLALEQGLPAQQALERLRAQGLDPAAHALLRFVETEVARRTPRMIEATIEPANAVPAAASAPLERPRIKA